MGESKINAGRWERLKLIVVRGVDEGKQFIVTEAAKSIGRDAHNGIVLHDTEISRRHAEILRHPEGFLIRDVGSVNGTHVNNQTIKETLLQPGDQIQIGQTIMMAIASQTSQPRKSTGNTDLRDRISLITRQDVELSSAIVKTVAEGEGSKILAHPEGVKRPWLKNALVNLGILYELTQLVNRVLDLDELMDRVLALIFKSLEADRGCILLKEPDSTELKPAALRWRDDNVNEEDKLPMSRSIIEHVLKEREGLLVSDAGQDDRFKARQSIVRFGIQEVICVPMKGRHETLGVLYLDTHSVLQDFLDEAAPLAGAEELDKEKISGRFTEDHLSLAIAIAHQAALAVEETRYREAMLQSERLAAVGQTVAALSHHIKNILQGVQSGSHIVKMGLEEDPQDNALIQQGWAIVEKNQAKISNLVMDMLSFSKERDPVREEVDVNQLVKDVLEMLLGRSKEIGAKFRGKLGDVPICHVDPDGIHRALLNVVSNALDAVEDRPNPQVQVRTESLQDDSWVTIEVVDNGVGIENERLEDIFKPFLSTKGARGTGLGLAVSRKILREHGGDIVVESQSDKGSRFQLRFPVRTNNEFDLEGTSSSFPSLDL